MQNASRQFQQSQSRSGTGSVVTPLDTHANSSIPTKLKHRPLQTLAKVQIDPLKVISCSGVRHMNGNLVAVPFEVQKFASPRKPFRHVSVSHADFAPKRESSCGDDHKPLQRFDVNAQRNRLPQDKFKPIDRNKSQVLSGGKYPRQFVTTNHNIHRGETGVLSSNASIVANKTRFYHSLQAR